MGLIPAKRTAAHLAGSFPGLMVAARRVAADVAPGCHGRRQVGQGEAFWQFRPYENGDPIRQVDWRQSARGDHVFIRQHEWEAAQTVRLWVANDAAMTYHRQTDLPSRFDRGVVLALALTMLLGRGREKIAPLAAGYAPAFGTGALHQLERWLASKISLKTSHKTAPPQQADFPPDLALPAHGRMVLFTDGWQPLDQWAELIAHYHQRRQIGHLVQIIDPAEDRLPFQGRIKFRGFFGETPETIAHIEAARPQYQQRVRDHQAGLADLCRRAGWYYTRHRLDQPPSLCLLGLYQHLANPGAAL
jgi:uncharacterized protein (DUF58 family)